MKKGKTGQISFTVHDYGHAYRQTDSRAHVLAYTWDETTPRWREITVVAKVYPANVYSRQQIEIYDAASGNSLSLLYSSATDLQRARRAAPRRHDLGELRNKVKRSSAAVARFPAQRARPPSPREKVRAVHVYVVHVTKTVSPRIFAFLPRQKKINLRIITYKESKGVIKGEIPTSRLRLYSFSINSGKFLIIIPSFLVENLRISL